MSSIAPNHSHSMNNNDDSEFYKMVELRLSHFNKYGEDHPDYLPKIDGDAQQQEISPVAEVALQVDSVDPLPVYEALPTTDQKNLQQSVLNPGTSTESAQVSATGGIQEGTHPHYVPSVADMAGVQQNSSSMGVLDKRSLASGSGVAQEHFGSMQKVQPREYNQGTEVKSRGTGNVNVAGRGEVRDSPTGHGIEYKDSRTGIWSPAVRHADIRACLLQEADHMATLYGGYDFPPAKGLDPNDRTAFVPEHKTWGPDRRNRPEINFIFDRPETPLPTHVQPNTKPSYWVWHGLVVLDHHDKLMRKFDDCPTTLASCIEGFRIDAILKRNCHMEPLDLWGRLPPSHTARRSDMSLKVVPIVTPAALNNVAMRWRYNACVLSFTRRWGSDDAKDFLTQFLTPQQLEANTTRGREDLTKKEVAELLEYKKAAASARRKGAPPPAIARRVNNVAALPAVSPYSATTAQAASPAGSLTSHVDPVKRVSNDGVEYDGIRATGLVNNQIVFRGQKRQFEETFESRDVNNVQPEDSQTTPEYRLVPPAKRARRSLQTSVDGDPTPGCYSLDKQQYHQGGATSFTSLTSLGTVEEPPAKERPGRSMVNGSITQHVSQEQEIELAQGQRSALDISSAGSNPLFEKKRTPPSPNIILSDGGQTECAYPDSLDPSQKNRKTVPAGFRHEIYPIGLPIMLFCPDDTVVRQGIITKGENTVWRKEKIPDTIESLRKMDASQELSHSVPSEIFRKAQTIVSNNPIPTEPYSYEVPEGFEPLNYPVGKKIVCVYPSIKKIVGGVIARDGQNLWQELSTATTIDLLEQMDRSKLKHQP